MFGRPWMRLTVWRASPRSPLHNKAMRAYGNKYEVVGIDDLIHGDSERYDS